MTDIYLTISPFYTQQGWQNLEYVYTYTLCMCKYSVFNKEFCLSHDSLSYDYVLSYCVWNHIPCIYIMLLYKPLSSKRSLKISITDSSGSSDIFS